MTESVTQTPSGGAAGSCDSGWMSALSTTPDPPYYAVIFASTASSDTAGYAEAAAQMAELAAHQPGFLGVDSARSDGVGITVSYWETEEAILAWRTHAEHTVVREAGRVQWYDRYELRVARVERAYGWRR